MILISKHQFFSSIFPEKETISLQVAFFKPTDNWHLTEIAGAISYFSKAPRSKRLLGQGNTSVLRYE